MKSFEGKRFVEFPSGDRQIVGGRSVYAEALDLVMPVHDVPGYAQILSGLANRTALEFGIHGDCCVSYVSALLDNDLLRTVYVEHIHDELLRIIGILHDLDVLAGLILQLDHMLSFLSDSDVTLSFLNDEHEFVLGVHAVDGVGLGDLLEKSDVPERILGKYDISGHGLTALRCWSYLCR